MASKRELLLKLKKKKVRQTIAIITNKRVVVNRILEIMNKHIGKENAISKLNLFRSVFKTNPEEVTPLQEWFMWELIKSGMHTCRQRTKCFIVSKLFPVSKYSSKGQGMWCYWVANDMLDYHVYKNNIERNIRAMRNMEKKCERSIRLGWYGEDWTYG